MMSTNILHAILVLWTVLSPVAVSVPTQSTGNYTTFMSQQVDHLSDSRETFLQQYQVVDRFFRPGGPIFFVQGAESAEFTPLEGSVALAWAESLGGVATTLEHRFFGQSSPSNASDLAARYETMTLENVMLDSVSFIEFLKNTVPDRRDSRTIVVGTSYGGFLAAALRMNHPETFYGGVAWGAPITDLGIDDSDRSAFATYDYTSRVYLEQSRDAAVKVKDALQDIAAAVEDQDAFNSFTGQLELCEPPSNATENAAFLGLLISQYELVAQYDKPYESLFKANPIEWVVNATRAANDTTSVLKAVLDASANQDDCIVLSRNSLSKELAEEPYAAAGCHFFYSAFSSCGISKDSIFPVAASASPSLDFGYNCLPYNVQGAYVPTPLEFRNKYLLSQDDLEHSQRLLFPKGEYDPASGGAGPDSFPKIGSDAYLDKMASRSWTVSQMSHGEDAAFVSRELDKQSVLHAKRVEFEYVKGWLE